MSRDERASAPMDWPAHAATWCASPGGFGLGQVPARLKPDATTTHGLRLLLDRLRARRPPARRRGGQSQRRRRLPGEPRHGVPQGLGGAHALARRRPRAPRRLLRNARGELEPVSWETALRRVRRAVQGASSKRHGPESVALLGTGQIPTEELAFLGALAKFGMGMRHGDGNTRQCMATAVVAYKQVVRLRRAALHLRGLRGVRRARVRRRRTCASRTRSCGSGSAEPASARDHRHRSAQDRDRDGRDAALALRPKVRPRAALRPGEPADRAAAGSTATSSTRTRPASRSFASSSRAFTPERVSAATGSDRRATRATSRQHDSSRASAFRSGGRWASTRATRARAPPRPSSISR